MASDCRLSGCIGHRRLSRRRHVPTTVIPLDHGPARTAREIDFHSDHIAAERRKAPSAVLIQVFEPGQPSTGGTQIAASIQQPVTGIVASVDVDQRIDLERGALERLGGLHGHPDPLKNLIIVEIGDRRIFVGETKVSPNLQIVGRAESVDLREPRPQMVFKIDLEGEAGDSASGSRDFNADSASCRSAHLKPKLTACAK